MFYGGRSAKDDLEKLFKRFGTGVFEWKDTHDLNLENKPQFFKYNNLLIDLGKNDYNCKMYKINPAYLKKNNLKKYKLKRKPLYPERTYTGVGVRNGD